jgi:hypothetical protein
MIDAFVMMMAVVIDSSNNNDFIDRLLLPKSVPRRVSTALVESAQAQMLGTD